VNKEQGRHYEFESVGGSQYSKNTKIKKRWGEDDPLLSSSYGGAAPDKEDQYQAIIILTARCVHRSLSPENSERGVLILNANSSTYAVHGCLLYCNGEKK